jgi:hypothetical protein
MQKSRPKMNANVVNREAAAAEQEQQLNNRSLLRLRLFNKEYSKEFNGLCPASSVIMFRQL